MPRVIAMAPQRNRNAALVSLGQLRDTLSDTAATPDDRAALAESIRQLDELFLLVLAVATVTPAADPEPAPEPEPVIPPAEAPQPAEVKS